MEWGRLKTREYVGDALGRRIYYNTLSRKYTSRKYTTRKLATTYGSQTWDSPATDWCGLSFQGGGRSTIRRPTSEWDPPSVARKTDWYRRGSFHISEGGHQAPEPQDVQSEARVGPKTVPEDNVRDSGKDRRNFMSQIEMLVDTVSHMQKDLAMLRDENRALRTGWFRLYSGRHSRLRKCRGSTEPLVGNSITKCLKQLCGQMAGTMIQRQCNCFRIWKEMR